jgi:hypothetical protein
MTLRPATRPTTGVLLPASGVFGSAADTEGFVMEILSRYAGEFAGVAPVDAVLRALPDTNISNVFQMIATLALRPALVIRLTSLLRSAPGVTARPAPSGNATPVWGPHRATTTASRTIFERVFARTQRIETLPALGDNPMLSPSRPERNGVSPQRRWDTAWAPIPAMVLRHSPASSQEGEELGHPNAVEPTPTPAFGAAPARATRFAPVPMPPMSLSSSELGRLTDEVVRAIDRRIIAQRERRGVV